MLETSHVIVGAAIATSIPNPVIALPLAFASHFLLDKIPHWNPHLNTETEKYGKPTPKTTRIVVADLTLSAFSLLAIASLAIPDVKHSLIIVAAGIAAILPDMVEGPYFFLKIRSETIKKWILFQKAMQVDTSLVPGLATQALTIIAAFWWILT